MKILVLGGTVFLGRHVVEAALAVGHELTLFNRGRSNPGLFGGVVEELHGDRDGDLGPLAGRRWDVVVDTCGYVPRLVTKSARLLADAVERYVFISSLSVYADGVTPGQDESARLAVLEDDTVEEITGETYGGLKALCEDAVAALLPGRSQIIRPGLIVGPHDPSDRFTYWPVRAARAIPVLAPPSDAPVEFTDVRDLAAWIVSCGETGAFNASGKSTFGELLDTCAEVAGADRFVRADEAFLLAQKVEPWTDLPVWVASDAPGFCTRSTQRAVDAGLTFRPIEETVRDTLAWATPDRELLVGLAAERERELLDMLANSA